MSFRRLQSEIAINFKTRKLTVQCATECFVENYVQYNPRKQTKYELMNYIHNHPFDSFEKTVDHSLMVWKIDEIDDKVIVKIPDCFKQLQPKLVWKVEPIDKEKCGKEETKEKEQGFWLWLQKAIQEEQQEKEQESPLFHVGDFKTSVKDVSHGRWILCDGSYYLCSKYPELFSVIGYRYGDFRSLVNFRVPNLQKRQPLKRGRDFIYSGRFFNF